MKTAISVPDETFEWVTRRAHQLGMSRSEFFSVAARRYLQELDRASLTEQINQALDAVEHDDSSRVAVSAGRRRLASSESW